VRQVRCGLFERLDTVCLDARASPLNFARFPSTFDQLLEIALERQDTAITILRRPWTSFSSQTVDRIPSKRNNLAASPPG
jgi:hypothetical protein